MRRGGLMAVGWVAAATLATATGVGAVTVIGRGLSGPSGEVMTADEIDRALASAPPPASPSAAPSPAPTPPGERLYQSPGGTVIAHCAGGVPVLTSWTPADGYRLREVEEGEVSFARGEERLDVEVTCAAGEPVFTVDNDD